MTRPPDELLTHFCDAAHGAELQACKEDLRVGLNANSTVPVGAGDRRPLLFFAAHSAFGNDLVAMLLAHGADPNARAYSGDTLLHEISGTGVQRLAYADIARTLVSAGANVNALDDRGRTPLDRAIAVTHAMMAHSRDHRHEHPDLLVSRFLVEFLQRNGGEMQHASRVQLDEIHAALEREIQIRSSNCR